MGDETTSMDEGTADQPEHEDGVSNCSQSNVGKCTTVTKSSQLVNAGSHLSKVDTKIELLKRSLAEGPHARKRAAKTEREIVKAMLVANATQEDIAEYLDIGVNTLRGRYAELLRTAKKDTMAAIGGQLANMALGYRHLVDPDTGEITKQPVEEKTQVSAAQFYAARVGKWVEKTEHEVTGKDGGPILSATLSAMDDQQLSSLLAGLLATGPKPLEATVVSE